MASPAHWFSGNSLVALLSRFSVVGVAATVTYFLVANLLIVTGISEPARASVVGYFAGMVISFLGQSRFTFAVGRNTWSQVFRFAVLSAIGLAISYGAVRLAVATPSVHPFWGTVATAVLVPAVSFTVMKVWVFGPSSEPETTSS